MNKQYKNKIGVFAVCVVAFSYLLIINLYTPMMGEDYALLSFYPKDTTTLNFLDRLSKMIYRIRLQMSGWNVRLGEQISIVFGCFNKKIFDVFNSLCVIYFLCLINKFAFKSIRPQHCWLYYLFPYTLIVTFQPALGEIFFWKTGSTNYLWALCILLTFALPIRYLLGENKTDIIGSSKLKHFLLVVLGFFAGVTNENTVITVWVVYLFVIVYGGIKKIKNPIWIYTSFISYSLGFLYMVKAPSTAVRMAYYKAAYNIGKLSIIDYCERAGNVVKVFFNNNILLFLIALVTLSIAMVIYKKSREKTTTFWEGGIIVLLSVFPCGALIFSPYIEIRAFLLPDFLMITCATFYLKYIVEKIKKNILIYIIGILLTSISIIPMIKIFKTYKEYYSFCTERENAIYESVGDDYYWGQYYGENNSRILTTREDYLLGNPQYLINYFNKNIIMISGNIGDLGIFGYKEHKGMGNIDDYMVDVENHQISVNGWISFCDMEKDKHPKEVYTIINVDNTDLKFRSVIYPREDVKQALSSDVYLNSGFYSNGGLPEKYGEILDKNISAVLIDRYCKLYYIIE